MKAVELNNSLVRKRLLQSLKRKEDLMMMGVSISTSQR
jgi:hypothetical protein